MDEPFGRVGTTPRALGVDWRLRAKHFAIRSPLDSLVSRLQFARDRGRGRREPELDELHREGAALHACIRRELTARSNCVDVGAHIGSVLRHIERCAPRGNHVAIEADPAKASLLARSFRSVEVISAAVGDQPGAGGFEVDLRRRGYSRLVPSRSADSVDPNVVRVDVPITTLDAVIGERKVDFIKLDVEGGELDALRGAPRTLSRRPVVLFEAGMHAERDWQADMSGLHDLLSDAGYAISTVTDHLHARDPLNLEQFLATHEWPYRAWNFIARPL